MLDTNIVSELARYPQGHVSKRISNVGPDGICISIITSSELRYGCARKGSVKSSTQIEAILSSVNVLALDVPADEKYGRIKAELEAVASRLDPMIF